MTTGDLAEWVRRSTARSGVPEKVKDKGALRDVARQLSCRNPTKRKVTNGT